MDATPTPNLTWQEKHVPFYRYYANTKAYLRNWRDADADISLGVAILAAVSAPFYLLFAWLFLTENEPIIGQHTKAYVALSPATIVEVALVVSALLFNVLSHVLNRRGAGSADALRAVKIGYLLIGFAGVFTLTGIAITLARVFLFWE